MTDYVAAGFDPAGFWALTPRVYGALIAGAVAREKRADQRAVTMAWLTARLQRAAKIPALRDMLRHKDPRQPVGPARLAALGRNLPTITMDEWKARHG